YAFCVNPLWSQSSTTGNISSEVRMIFLPAKLYSPYPSRQGYFTGRIPNNSKAAALISQILVLMLGSDGGSVRMVVWFQFILA
ncbi:MAG: hypothetical protein AAF944_25905, partial [Bacteroidota bacterium]